MWKDFQKALEKRVRTGGKGVDKYMIEKSASQVLFGMFGSIGMESISFKVDGKVIIIKSSQSVWRSELCLKQGQIKREINKKLGQDVVDRVVVAG